MQLLSTIAIANAVNFNQSLLSLCFFANVIINLKKGKDCFCFGVFYGRFLSNKIASKAPTTMIATNKPAIAGTKYMSAGDCGGASVGAVVG